MSPHALTPTARDVLFFWKQATLKGGAGFYGEFERLTGLSESTVREHFGAWCKLRHETAERIASENDVTVQEAGFQAYLACVLRGGLPIYAVVDEGYTVEDGDPNPRGDKYWPPSEDCPGCDGQVGRLSSHRFGCIVRGVMQVRVPVIENEDGTFRVEKP